MAWDEQKSRDRVAKNDYSDFEINVKDLTRTMDFDNLGKKDVRRAKGAHIYEDVSNFHDAVKDAGADKVKQKKLLRSASVLRKVQGELLDENEVGHIQLQAARLHSLCFKPYNTDKENREADRAKRAVITAITLNSYLYDVFNDVFSEVRNFEGACGIAAGTSYIANIGYDGERELICLGSCANLGAKIVDQTQEDSITITKEVYDLLPDCLQEHFKKSRTVAQTVTYQSTGLRWSQYPELASELGVTFDAKKLKKRTEEYRDALPLSDMEISEAEVLIDIEKLTERNSKRTSAVPIYADLDGFTKYVQEAENDNTVISLVRKLHMIRHEFHTIIKQDYDGLVLQHQGDRTFAIIHLPSGDKLNKRCNNGVDIAIGLQSSMEHVLNERLGDQKEIHVAVGLDVGQVIITRLGKKGEREVICLGPKVTSAEGLQLASSGRQTRISKAIYDNVEDETKKGEFKEDGDNGYVAKNLTFLRLDDLKAKEAARKGSLGSEVTGNRITVVTSRDRQQQQYGNSKPWRSR